MSSVDVNTLIVPIYKISDGDPTHRPPPSWTEVKSPTLWLEKLAQQWMRDRQLEKPGRKYILDRLPTGYALFSRPMPSNPTLSTHHLYGHPKRKIFDSPNRFYPHFSHFMANRTSQGCPCTVCNATSGTAAPMKSSTPKAPQVVADSKKPSPPTAPQTVATPTKPSVPRAPQVVPNFVQYVPKTTIQAPQADEEQFPDMTRNLINRLKKESIVDTAIEERMSMDWRAEKGCLAEMFQRVLQDETWIPRVGELALFVRDEVTIRLDPLSNQYRIFDEQERTFKELPKWEAGVIAQTPTSAPSLDITVGTKPHEDQSVVFAGFRMEPYPDPNGRDKALTKQYTYVTPTRVWPFTFYNDLLRGLGTSTWAHPTVGYACTVMSSVSLVDRYHFRGSWPSAAIFCRGIFIGAEFITVGDVVRLLPESRAKDTVTDVLCVSSIRLVFTDLDKASDNDYDRGPTHKSAIFLYGTAFTMDAQRSASTWKSFESRQDVIGHKAYNLMSSYTVKGWMPMHAQSKQVRVSFTRVLGRLCDANTMHSWFPASESERVKEERFKSALGQRLLSMGLSGVQHARDLSARRDKRIYPGKAWFWGDSRAETLNIETLNSVTVTYYDEDRDSEQFDNWQSAIRVLEKTASVEERRAAVEEEGQLNPQKKRLKALGGMGPLAGAASSTSTGSEQEDVVKHVAAAFKPGHGSVS